MDLTTVSYACYVLITATLTVWVARTLFKNGRRFLVDAFRGDEGLADSVNRLLVVGFYLVNIGYISLALKLESGPTSIASLIESLSAKIGVVALVVGGMHYFNMFVFARIRTRGTESDRPQPLAGRPRIDPNLPLPPPPAPMTGNAAVA